MILKDFLTLPFYDDPISVKLVEFTNKTDFLNYLENHNCLNEDYDLVHLSGHGCVREDNTAHFFLPRGTVQPDEFPGDCFMGTHVGFSACDAGRTAFSRPFIRQTRPITILGPQRSVGFSDACLFWINYYSLVMHFNYKPRTSYRKTVDLLKKRIPGSFQFFESRNFQY